VYGASLLEDIAALPGVTAAGHQGIIHAGQVAYAGAYVYVYLVSCPGEDLSKLTDIDLSLSGLYRFWNNQHRSGTIPGRHFQVHG